MADELTKREREVLELGLRWVQAKYVVEEAIIRQRFIRAAKMLLKYRRDSHATPQNKTTK